MHKRRPTRERVMEYTLALLALLLMALLTLPVGGRFALAEEGGWDLNPRITANNEMDSGQEVIWSCLWLGYYPQTEVEEWNIPAVQDIHWSSEGIALGGDGNRYKRIKKEDATNDQNWWVWDDGYRYFKYEPIKWRILQTYDDGTALVVSDAALDCVPYNISYEELSWETSTIRSWLNGYKLSSNQDKIDFRLNSFYNNAFSQAQLNTIVSSEIKNEANSKRGTSGGNDCQDKLFLLSEAQVHGEAAQAYGFIANPSGDDEGRSCQMTNYAEMRGGSQPRPGVFVYNKKSCSWWLRSPGYMRAFAAYVDPWGLVDLDGDSVNGAEKCIRPAMIVKLEDSAARYAGEVSSASGTISEPECNEVSWKTDLSWAEVTIDEECVYDGDEWVVTPVVTLGETTLTPGVDYVCSYENNINAGTATVIVKGVNSYAGCRYQNFTIEPQPITDIALSGSSYVFNNKNRTPAVKVYAGVDVLVPAHAENYTVTYANNRWPGKAVVSVVAKGNYTGTIERTFTINNKTIKEKCFTDIPLDSWQHKVIHPAAELMLIEGYPDKTFKPNNKITRAQIIVILWRMAGRPSAKGAQFPDAIKGEFYWDALIWGKANGVAKGYPDGSFKPNKNISRQELAIVLARYARIVGKKTVTGTEADFKTMKDKNTVDPEAVPYIGWCFKNGLLSGKNGKVAPKDNATRAEATKMILGLFRQVR